MCQVQRLKGNQTAVRTLASAWRRSHTPPPPPLTPPRRLPPHLPAPFGSDRSHKPRCQQQNVPSTKAARKARTWQLERSVESTGLEKVRTPGCGRGPTEEALSLSPVKRRPDDSADLTWRQIQNRRAILVNFRHQLLNCPSYVHSSELLLGAGRESCPTHVERRPKCAHSTRFLQIEKNSVGQLGLRRSPLRSASAMGLDGAGWDQPSWTTAFAAGPPPPPPPPTDPDKCNRLLHAWVDQQSTFPAPLVFGIVEIAASVQQCGAVWCTAAHCAPQHSRSSSSQSTLLRSCRFVAVVANGLLVGACGHVVPTQSGAFVRTESWRPPCACIKEYTHGVSTLVGGTSYSRRLWVAADVPAEGKWRARVTVVCFVE